ncbi:quinone-dependent dihydroorotate dehydrogenase [Sphingomonas sp. ID0503]|uniref:quinone-dependent dihydroorotate dehydrogenase n=1 Tax=Sphingomonas sp. ID0503 TaxID=3399691 RepID=UPI003AFA841B
MSLYPIVRPLLFRATDAENAHRLTIRALAARPHRMPPKSDPMLRMSLAGLEFSNPVGLAAGFDKNAEVPDAMLGLGFGFAEVGTVTPLPQAGNPRPRIFRLPEDRAVINRLGFNNEGQAAARERLAKRKRRGVVGVNIGANKDAADRVADYVAGTKAMADVADYLTVNISSPNTPGLRALQDRGALADLLVRVVEARGAFGPPIFLKVAPDLQPDDIDDIAAVAIGTRIDALIVSNTTIARPVLRSKHAGETGGLSGAPLKDMALQRLRDFRRATGGSIPLIAVGGIASAEDAYARFRAGACLVQLYTALVYEGPGLAKRIVDGLPALLKRDGFADLASAVGTEG